MEFRYLISLILLSTITMVHADLNLDLDNSDQYKIELRPSPQVCYLNDPTQTGTITASLFCYPDGTCVNGTGSNLTNNSFYPRFTNPAGYYNSTTLPATNSTDQNNYTTNISFNGTTTKCLRLARNGMINLTACFNDTDTSASPGGIVFDVQFNGGNNNFNGSDNFIYNPTTGDLDLIDGRMYIQETSRDTAFDAYGTDGTGWDGRGVFRGPDIAVVIGQYNPTGTPGDGRGWIGCHDSDLSAWADCYISPDGSSKTYIGNDQFFGINNPIMTIDNNFMDTFGSAVKIYSTGIVNPAQQLTLQEISSNIEFPDSGSITGLRVNLNNGDDLAVSVNQVGIQVDSVITSGASNFAFRTDNVQSAGDVGAFFGGTVDGQAGSGDIGMFRGNSVIGGGSRAGLRIDGGIDSNGNSGSSFGTLFNYIYSQYQEAYGDWFNVIQSDSDNAYISHTNTLSSANDATGFDVDNLVASNIATGSKFDSIVGSSAEGSHFEYIYADNGDAKGTYTGQVIAANGGYSYGDYFYDISSIEGRSYGQFFNSVRSKNADNKAFGTYYNLIYSHSEGDDPDGDVYAIFINNLSTTAPGKEWGIYEKDIQADNYFAGNMTINQSFFNSQICYRNGTSWGNGPCISINNTAVQNNTALRYNLILDNASVAKNLTVNQSIIKNLTVNQNFIIDTNSFTINTKVGQSINISVICDVNLVALTKKTQNFTFMGGVLVANTTCT